MPKKKPPRRRSVAGTMLRIVASLLLIGGIAGTGIVAAGYWYFGRDLPDVRTLTDWKPKQVSRVLAADGTVIAELYKERRTVVPREKIPDVVVSAVLSAEDGEFYKHEGLDYTGMARALLNSVKAGHVTGSGSTITQQVVKNLVLSPEKTFTRKAKELILARRIEQAFSKDEILWLYLNAVYFGHGRYGVQEAARYYFGKDVGELTVVEAATIAGVIQSPERLSPRKHPERARDRRAYVLREMADNGFITAAAAKQATRSPPSSSRRRRWRTCPRRPGSSTRSRNRSAPRSGKIGSSKAGCASRPPSIWRNSGRRSPPFRRRSGRWTGARVSGESRGAHPTPRPGDANVPTS
jgi:penicillin-binding protein 1A